MIHTGNCLTILPTLPDQSVQAVITSPPYYGLRDYGVEGQHGLEETPAEYIAVLVAVFREAHRVLKDDGTLWVNMGDSYNGYMANHRGTGLEAKRQQARKYIEPGAGLRTDTAKNKDLLGMPWRLAFALQQPYYTGRIKDERDRIWLAAMLDAEGCLFIHKRKAGQHNGQGYYRQNDNYGPGVEISNTSLAVIERIAALTGQGSICSQGTEENGRRKQRLYRWNLRTVECRDFVRELYPHLVAKKQQARILIGCPSSGERAEAAHAALIALHRSGSSDVDFPDPKPMFEPGFYLRQDIIWSKCNPMPESVRDRCTKAHEYLFLFAKRGRYYFDQEAIKEPASESTHARLAQNVAAQKGSTRANGGTRQDRPMKPVMGWATGAGSHSPIQHAQPKGGDRKLAAPGSGTKNNSSFDAAMAVMPDTRNKRSVWTIPSQPFSEAHFATFPEALVEPCVLAGSRPGDTVLDPYMGAGTTALVCERFGRRWIGIELNKDYAAIAERRLRGITQGLALEVPV